LIKLDNHKQISWSGSGNLVAITSTDSLYLLQFDRDAYNEALNSGVAIGDEGVEAAFDLINEVSEK
jgi:coatomer subunit beta'